MGIFSTTNCVSAAAATKITGMIPSAFPTLQCKETLQKKFQLASCCVMALQRAEST